MRAGFFLTALSISCRSLCWLSFAALVALCAAALCCASMRSKWLKNNVKSSFLPFFHSHDAGDAQKQRTSRRVEKEKGFAPHFLLSFRLEFTPLAGPNRTRTPPPLISILFFFFFLHCCLVGVMRLWGISDGPRLHPLGRLYEYIPLSQPVCHFGFL